MSRDTRCSHLPSHQVAQRQLPSDVRVVRGKNGPVYQLGPSFAEPVAPIEQDPGPALRRELERQIAARRGKNE